MTSANEVAPARLRGLVSGIVVVVTVLTVWKVIDYRSQPPPPPIRDSAAR